MKLLTTIKPRRDGTVTTIADDGGTWIFQPNDDGALVCDVEDEATVRRLLLLEGGAFEPAHDVDRARLHELMAAAPVGASAHGAEVSVHPDEGEPGPPPNEGKGAAPDDAAPASKAGKRQSAAHSAVAPGVERTTALAWLHARCIDCDDFQRIVNLDSGSEPLISVDEDRVRYRTFDQRALDQLAPEEVEAITFVEFHPSKSNWIRPFPVSVFDVVELKRGPSGYLFDVDLRELESVLLDAADGGSHWSAFEAPAARDLEGVLAGLDCGVVDSRQKAAAHGLHAETDALKAQALEHYEQHRHEYKDKEVAADALAKLVPLSRKTLRNLLKGK